MQISTSLFFARSTSQMATLSAHADTLQAQISTTKKYAAPSDNIIAYQRLQGIARTGADARSEEHTSELQSLMRISYAVFCLKKKKKTTNITNTETTQTNKNRI